MSGCCSGKNKGFACITRNHRKQTCRAPVRIQKRINNLLCDKTTESIYCRTGLTTFENLDWNFDRMFEGRSKINTPCDRCPQFSCQSRKLKVISTSKCRPRKRRF